MGAVRYRRHPGRRRLLLRPAGHVWLTGDSGGSRQVDVQLVVPAQDTALAATALLGALHESLVGPLAPDNLEDPAKLRDAVQTVTLLALRAVGVMDARARGLVVQAVLPTGTLVGA